MFKRAIIKMTFTVDLDALPGWGHQPEDWVKLIQREFLAQSHYGARATVDSVKIEPKALANAR